MPKFHRLGSFIIGESQIMVISVNEKAIIVHFVKSLILNDEETITNVEINFDEKIWETIYKNLDDEKFLKLTSIIIAKSQISMVGDGRIILHNGSVIEYMEDHYMIISEQLKN